MPFLIGVAGICVSLICNVLYKQFIFEYKLNGFGYYVYLFFNRKWYFDLVYNYFILNKILDFGYHISFKLIDKGLLDEIGPYGLISIISKLTTFVTSIQTGIIYNYALLMFVSVLLLIFFTLFNDYFYSEFMSFVQLFSFLFCIYFIFKKLS